jgi:hypothetical protein
MKKLTFTRYFGPDDPPPPVPPKPPEANLTQEQFNNALAAEKKKWQARETEYTRQLEELKTNSSLTVKEKEELAAKLEEMQNVNLTKEQLAAKEQEKIKKKFESDLNTTTEQAKGWQNRFSKYFTESKIREAAALAEAFSSDQMVEALSHKAKLVEVLEDGKPTGEYEVKVNVKVKDKSGKPINLELDLAEAMKQMKDWPEQYGNLFKSTLTSGLGGNNNGVTGNPSIDAIKQMSMDEYLKTGRKSLGLT